MKWSRHSTVSYCHEWSLVLCRSAGYLTLLLVITILWAPMGLLHSSASVLLALLDRGRRECVSFILGALDLVAAPLLHPPLARPRGTSAPAGAALTGLPLSPVLTWRWLPPAGGVTLPLALALRRIGL